MTMIPPHQRTQLAKAGLLTAATLLASTLYGDTVTWVGADEALWSSGTSWDTTNPPATSGDDIVYNAPSSTLDSYIDAAWAENGSINSLTINDNGGAGGTLNIRLKDVTSFEIGAGGVTSLRTTGITNLRAGAGFTLDVDQTWTTSGNNTAGVINIWSDLKGSGDLTLTGSSRYGFVGGNSDSWSGDLTLESTQVYLYSGSQFSRLGQTLTMNNLSAQNAVAGVINSDGIHTMASNVVYDDQGNWDFLYSYSAGSATSTQVNMTGNWSSTAAMKHSVVFNLQENDRDVMLTTLSGDNSGLTSSITSGDKSGLGAIHVEQGFLQVESDNALGAGNSLFVTLGDRNTGSAQSAGLHTTDGHDIASDVLTKVNGSTGASDVYVGISGAGSATFSGDVYLAATWNAAEVTPDVHLQADSGATATFSGTIQSESAVRTNQTDNVSVQGGGTIILSGANTYTATTTVTENSTLLVNNTTGSGTGEGPVVVESGSTLGGTGFIASGGSNGVTAQSGAIIAPGASIGSLTLDGENTTGVVLTADAGSTFAFELGAGDSSDKIVFFNYTLGDFVLNDNIVNFSGAQEGSYLLFEFYSDSGSVLTAHDLTEGLVLGSGLDGFDATLNYNTDNITLDLVAIPESSAWMFMGVLALFLPLMRRRVCR